MKKSLLITFCLVLSLLIIFACNHDYDTDSGSGSTALTQPELAPGEYSITYVLDGGSWVDNYTPTNTYTAEQYVSLPNAAKIQKSGYTFKGWKDANQNLTFGFAKGTTGNKTYTANWQEEEHTPVGFYQTANGDVACEAGKYQDHLDQTLCSNCQPGKYSGQGYGNCIFCPAGTYSSAGSSSCTLAPAGTYATAGASTPVSCPAGTYTSTPGSTSPQPCPVGSYQPLTGQSSCTPCPDGKITDGTGSTSVTACH